MNKPIIYAISGLGADARVFDYLELSLSIYPVSWIKPHKNETLQAYTDRLLKTLDTSKPFLLLGVSFGGLVAVEIAKKNQTHTYFSNFFL